MHYSSSAHHSPRLGARLSAFFSSIWRLALARRGLYAGIIAAVFWIGHVLVNLGVPGYIDLQGNPKGVDFIQSYAVGRILESGDRARLYDLNYQSEVEHAVTAPETWHVPHGFLMPPFFALLFVPLARLPFLTAYALFIGINLALLAGAVRGLTAGVARFLPTFGWSLSFLPVVIALAFGQNSIISLFLLALVYLAWRRGRSVAAGVALGLLLYKPQLVLGVLLLWLMDWRRNRVAMLVTGAVGAVLALISVALSPEASRGYVELVRTYLPTMVYQPEFPIGNLHSLRTFFILLMPGLGGLGEALGGVTSLAAVALWFWGWYRLPEVRRDDRLTFASAIVLTLLITPHALIYEWTLLLIPAVLLWQAFGARQSALVSPFAAVWLAGTLSWQLTEMQILAGRLLGAGTGAVQISVPILLWASWRVWRLTTAATALQASRARGQPTGAA